MTSKQTTRLCVLATALLGLAACGGGGGEAGTSGSAPAAAPTSGAFAWLLKAQGPTDNLKYGLSLLHPATPGTEWVIEVSNSVVSDAKLVASGSVDVAGSKVDSLQPYALLYIVGGDVRRVPMQANGTVPLSRVQRAQSTSACSFVIEANDYAAPENSRYIVSTAGADGSCTTADDGRAEVSLTASGGLTFTPISSAVPLGVFRDVATLAPRGWIYPKTVFFWGPSPGTTVVTRTDTEPALTGVVAATYRSVLVDDGTQLSVLDFPSGTAPTESRLSAASTGGGGWTSIGFDAANHYVFRNSGSTTASSWTVLKISRVAPSATVLASGSGLLSIASMAGTQLYATVIGAADNRLLAISKTVGVPVKPLAITSSSTLTTVQTSASDVHQLWRVTNIGSAAITYAIEMIDEGGNIVYATSTGGFPMAVAEAGSVNFNLSENRTRFVFANGYGSKAFSDATLVGYDTAARTATPLGTLPGSIDFGSDFVFASTMGGPGSFMTGFAARSSGGAVQETGAKVFSFDASTAQSLKYTSSAQ
ncbi:MAG: hypothetical protein V4569_08295 [Pseudomonadota bacterium]